jgi:hypothetical protein
MSDMRQYSPPVELGDVMRGIDIGGLVESTPTWIARRPTGASSWPPPLLTAADPVHGSRENAAWADRAACPDQEHEELLKRASRQGWEQRLGRILGDLRRPLDVSTSERE